MRVLCFGDSNTYGFDPRSYLGGRYPAESRWVDLLAQKTGWEVRNAGENGRSIPQRPEELRQFCAILSGNLSLDCLIVMLGTNDLLQGADVAATAARMEAFLVQLPLEHERILLVSPPPMQYGDWVTEAKLINASTELAGRYQALARKLGTRFADAGHWGIELTFDGVHFSEKGHKAFAEGIYLTFISGDGEKP